ncbi:MAG: bifunctional demethylmenaquinone methyltransferase/2-methoxy-6-polyprenyl-1,4-benzoquinol methylase UbiE [bacterium]
MSEKIQNMFSDISRKYDILNDVLSFGIHRIWRRKVVKISGISGKDNVSILDLATGTGDLAIAFKRTTGNSGKISGIDFSEEMLKIAREKAKKNNLEIVFEKGDANALEFEDNSFDIASIAFGIRNVDSVIACLNEMARVVKPGGKVIILEFGQPQGLFSHIYKFYSKYIIPILGKIISKNFSAYNYLQDSSAKFPCREEFIKIMQSTGKFSDTDYKQLAFGIAFIYVGVVK